MELDKFGKKIYVSMAVLAGLFVYVWWFSANALWLGDDIYYRFIVGTSPAAPIGSLSDVIRSQIEHYLTVNGRFEAHFIVQIIICDLLSLLRKRRS